MSFIMTSVFSKINHLTRFNPTQLLNKSNYVLSSLCNTCFQSQLSNPVQINAVDKQAQKTTTEGVLKKINEEQNHAPSRIFAVVQICGKQFKVTTNDVIIVEGYWPPDVGDKISLDKVLCAGSLNFSLIGTPLVQSGLVNVHATVIEKTLSHTKTHFRKKRRKQYLNINFYRMERTALRINDVVIGQLRDTVDEY